LDHTILFLCSSAAAGFYWHRSAPFTGVKISFILLYLVWEDEFSANSPREILLAQRLPLIARAGTCFRCKAALSKNRSARALSAVALMSFARENRKFILFCFPATCVQAQPA